MLRSILFILALLFNVFTYMYFSKKLDFEENRFANKEKKWNNDVDSITNKLKDANYFSLEKNENAQNYFNPDNATKTIQVEKLIPFVTEKDTIVKLQLIKKSLIKQGFYDSTLTVNDSIKLAKALNKLQNKWFIQPDGKIGKYTKQAFSYNREKIIKQVCMSMERWRWENKFPDKYAFINIPAFWLTVFEKDTVVMQSAIVCGTTENQTPILKSKIDSCSQAKDQIEELILLRNVIQNNENELENLKKNQFSIFQKKIENLRIYDKKQSIYIDISRAALFGNSISA